MFELAASVSITEGDGGNDDDSCERWSELHPPAHVRNIPPTDAAALTTALETCECLRVRLIAGLQDVTLQYA